ncbi:ABC transporter permease subunit [Luteimicrobium sp. DT211]|uniref:ABC transporter permease subunit n=1 Tax=Luteimicrobium sp. DT211 TaxID=3393412 RepID=UPI003CEEB946
MRLARVELDRFRSRRLVRWATVLAVGVGLLFGASSWWQARPPSAAQVAQAQEFVRQQQADWDANGAQQVKDCQDDQAANPSNYPADFDCATGLEPSLEVDDFLPSRGTFEVEGVGALGTDAYLLLGLALLLGASFVCAESVSGALSTWMTFEPRRTRVYGSKVSAAALGGAVVAIIGFGVALAAQWGAFALRDRAGATGHVWTQVTAEGGRVVVLAAAVAAIGAALGFLLRHTTAVLGLIVAYAALVDAAVVRAALGQPRWTLTVSSDAWITAHGTYTVENCTPFEGGMNCEYVEHVVSMTHGGLVLAGVTVVVVAVGWLVFRRRDVA